MRRRGNVSDEIIKQLEEEKKCAYEDFEECAEEHNLDPEYDDFFHRGIERAIAAIRAVERRESNEKK